MRRLRLLISSVVLPSLLLSSRVTNALPVLSPATMLSDFPSNPLLVGSSWTLSSTVFTTYFTTAFLKYDAKKQEQNKRKELLKSNSDFESQNINAAKALQIESERNRLPTRILRQISRPQLLTLYRFVGSFLIGIFVHPKMFRWTERLGNTVEAMDDFAVPAVFLFLANYFNSISLSRIGISLTYTSKCSIPLITVLIMLLLHGFEALPSREALFSLIPIAIGVAMASFNSVSFDLLGFLAAMGSATSQAALNVVSKRALINSGIGGLEAQRAMASVASIISILVVGGTTVYSATNATIKQQRRPKSSSSSSSSTKRSSSPHPPNSLSFAAVAAYHTEYVLSFMFVKLVEPVTYGACDAIRRLLIIILGRQMFGGDAFSMMNRIGIGFALIGAFCYSFASR